MIQQLLPIRLGQAQSVVRTFLVFGPDHQSHRECLSFDVSEEVTHRSVTSRCVAERGRTLWRGLGKERGVTWRWCAVGDA